MNEHTVTLTLPAELARRAEALAASRHLSLPELVAELLEHALRPAAWTRTEVHDP